VQVAANLRQSSDRLRETLFNLAGPDVVGSVWLDLFAGTGAVGLEALSRGADLVILNDRDRAALAVISKNLEVCEVIEGARVLEEDAFVVHGVAHELRERVLDPERDHHERASQAAHPAGGVRRRRHLGDVAVGGGPVHPGIIAPAAAGD
jgi:16S rRNA G966 N2-methylase RsmD